MQTMDLMPDSDGEVGSEALNSSQSSMSSRDGSCEDVRCSSFSRLSFDAAPAVPAVEQPSDAGLPIGSQVGVPSKPCRSSDPAFGQLSRSGAGRIPAGVGHRDFKLICRIGSGDIGTVYLCRLREESGGACVPGASEYVYAMKIVDKRVLAIKKKLERAATEKRILRALNHPFLPTLFADFDAAPHYSCVVMEYCGGGDLHTLRHRQPGGSFSVAATRFYAAEVLLALEYLHMLGVVYRDLKPENILIRSDGHIMLSDFDLSLESTSTPTVEHVNLSPPDAAHSAGYVGCTSSDPSCMPAFRTRRTSAAPSRLFVAEPVAARSCSFVGTHEYVAPEVASGRPHGSAVDWWAYGVLLYELLYGRTPFLGPTNEATLRNIIRQPLAFPPPTPSSSGGGNPPDSAARDLISGLLAKDPASRLGSTRGAADVKGHRFFKELNFALMRSCRPPFVPGYLESPVKCPSRKDEGSHGSKCGRKRNGGGNSLSFFTGIIGEDLSEYKKERLKEILHESAVFLNQELNETFGHILATLKIGSDLVGKGPLCHSSALNDDTIDPLCSKKRQALSRSPDNSGSCTDILYSQLGRTVCNDIQAINGDDRISEEAIQMYSNKMFEKLTKMEEDLEEFLNTVVSKCRPMTSAEMQRLGSQIQKLPGKALDRVVEIVRPQSSSGDALAGHVLVNLEEQDNVTLWRLYYHVQDVIKANQL